MARTFSSGFEPATMAVQVLLVGRDGQEEERTIPSDQRHLRLAVWNKSGIVTEAPPQLNEVAFTTREFLDSGKLDPGGRRIFFENGQPPVVAPPLVAGPTLAYRVWRAWKGQLHAMNLVEAPWPPRTPAVARCRREPPWVTPDHAAPNRYCGCGLYAHRQPAMWTFPGPDPLEMDGFVGGEVALWGRVIEHKLGYRAQYAYPVALWPIWEEPAGRTLTLEAGVTLARRYGVPWHPERRPPRAWGSPR